MKNFYLRRLYYIYDVPSNSYRGFHAHKKLKQIFICLQGSFHLKVTDGTYTDSVDLIPHDAYYLPSGYWRELSNFTPRTICLVLATEHYEKSDYIYDFKEFLKWKSNE
jgi:mannose-6-phosphate isomerase-like protein (cupin superfamily)